MHCTNPMIKFINSALVDSNHDSIKIIDVHCHNCVHHNIVCFSLVVSPTKYNHFYMIIRMILLIYVSHPTALRTRLVSHIP